MPDPVEGFTNVTENTTNLLVFPQGLAKSAIQFYKLIDRWISSCKSWLERSNNTIF